MKYAQQILVLDSPKVKFFLPYYTTLLSNLPIMATSPQQPLSNVPIKVAVVEEVWLRFGLHNWKASQVV